MRGEGGHRGEIGKCPADDEAEWAIREVLLGRLSQWGFLGEETGGQAAAAGEHHVWVVDPNDGTSSMQRGWRGHAVAIGVVRGGVPVLGVVQAVDAPDDDGDLITWAEGCGPVCRNGVAVAPIAAGGALTGQDSGGVVDRGESESFGVSGVRGAGAVGGGAEHRVSAGAGGGGGDGGDGDAQSGKRLGYRGGARAGAWGGRGAGRRARRGDPVLGGGA